MWSCRLLLLSRVPYIAKGSHPMAPDTLTPDTRQVAEICEKSELAGPAPPRTSTRVRLQAIRRVHQGEGEPVKKSGQARSVWRKWPACLPSGWPACHDESDSTLASRWTCEHAAFPYYGPESHEQQRIGQVDKLSLGEVHRATPRYRLYSFPFQQLRRSLSHGSLVLGVDSYAECMHAVDV
ncbi:hypothetical protein BCV70DRAFT_45230 [Testicularia cyperi]|uniref:Uncharacterized protein n=1 Tax=Testicularia cyperi TaxID=1882483 RepID=A0A317XHY3_9BASI|nr:hypothetical protein BCV70DRAFT_45230 [Testicularia cyperi]